MNDMELYNYLIKDYQDNARFYLDEYQEQIKLRDAWFKKAQETFQYIYTRFLRRS